jgi:diguanylate cyclase (GGDEF)-like protein
MTGRRRLTRLGAYIGVICAAALLVAARVGMTAGVPHVTETTAAIIGLLCVFLFAGELFPIQIGHEDAGVAYTFSGTAAVALIVVGPGWLPIAAQLVATLLDELRHRRRPAKTAFNLAHSVLAIACAREVYCLLTGTGFQSLQPTFHPNDFFPALVAAGVLFLVNTLLMSILLSLASGLQPFAMYLRYVRDELTMATTLLAAGPVVLLALQFSWEVAPVCALPVLAVRAGAKRAAHREFAAMHDPLTELPNRALLLQRTARALQTTEEGLTALILIDLDHFKEINDSLGHSVGDELLRHVAARLRNAVRPQDTAARLGGDEFAVLSTGVTTPDAASAVGNRLLEVLSAPYALDEITLHVEASIGVAIAPFHADNVDSLLQLVDVALYQAKAAGRDTVRLYDSTTDSSSAERLALMAELRSGMDEQLVLYYQPKCSALDGSLIGVEALVRWQHPKLGLLTPARFLPSAENTGLIVPLTVNVLRAGLKQLCDWDRKGLSISMSVNISPRHLTRPDLPYVVEMLLDEMVVDPRRLTLELTEDSLMTDPSRAISVLQRLRELGVGISIDDFGTGYSSLAYLRDLQATEVKIDRSFVCGSDVDRDLAVVHAAAQLGRSLGLTVVAEGVETAEQMRTVSDAGVQVLQGYHILPPSTADELVAWLERPQLWAQALRSASRRDEGEIESAVRQ